MRHIKASVFKAKCLQLMDEVARTGEPIVGARAHCGGTMRVPEVVGRHVVAGSTPATRYPWPGVRG